MFWPPSLAKDILDRSFRSLNGELGINPIDVEAFLRTCEADNVELLGWELWLVDHICSPDGDEPQRKDKTLWGAIPSWALITGAHSMVFSGSGSISEIRAEIASLGLENKIKYQWLEHVRFNFTLAHRKRNETKNEG
ncbi:hypothetical protein [Rhizobium sp. CF080]|uniref:hypothetical protein n=1 Tax=Rhizobium sp. (strain CF080) TaxID=1144310 RepID=UPI0012DD8E37|nr:hypothetical protein [Rhizobium sp. CF080]